jgi:hypothetical protein
MEEETAPNQLASPTKSAAYSVDSLHNFLQIS